MEPENRTTTQTKNDPMDIDQIYCTHVDAIYRYVYHCVGNKADAEDLTSQTFFKALNNLWRYRWSAAPISAWLYRIASNEVKSHFRCLRKMRSLDVEELVADGTSWETSAENSARNQIWNQVHHLLTDLKTLDQTLLVLRYFERKPFAEIAQITGKRVPALKMRVHRALKKLKAGLASQGVNHDIYRRTFEEPG